MVQRNKLAGGRLVEAGGVAIADAVKSFIGFYNSFGREAGEASIEAARSEVAGEVNEVKSRLNQLRKNAGVDDLGEAFVAEPIGSRTRDKLERCQRLFGLIDASKESRVLTGGLTTEEIAASKGYRSCLYALQTEFSDKRCRDKLKRADEIIGDAGGSIKTWERANSNIDKLINELGESGECPLLLNVLQGGAPGGTTPMLNIRKVGDTKAVPNLRNVLNDYIDVQYHINLSMVPEVEARRLQTRIGRKEARIENATIDELRQSTRRSGSVTLASTGEAERNLASIVEESLPSEQLERADEALYKTGQIQQIHSNLQKVASLWRRNISNVDGQPTATLGSVAQDIESASTIAARLTRDVRERRQEEVSRIINAIQNSDNIESGERTEIDVSNRNYYAIKSLKVSNVHSPDNSDPFISNLLTMEMILQEPHGLNLNEDLFELSRKLGYTDINPGRILYKVDIWFSGYNPTTGEWQENISFSDRGSNRKPIVSYYVVITGVEGNFTTTGTEYKLSFVPQGLMSVRPEEFSLEGMSIPTGGNPTLGTFLTNLAEAIAKKRQDETKEGLGGVGITRQYKFYVPDVLREAPFYQGEFLERYNMVSEENKDGAFITIGKDVDIMTLLRSVLSDLPEVQTLFLTDKTNTAFIDPVVHFTVRFNTRYATKRPEMHDYDGIVYEYIIEPFLSYKKAAFDAETVYQYTSPRSQMLRVQKMLELGMVTRVYDYLNTPENTDVIDFDVKLNRFYYETFKRSFDPGARKGLGTAATPSAVEDISNQIGLNRELKVNLDFSSDPALASRFSPDEQSLLRKIFGDTVDNMDGSGTTTNTGEAGMTTGFNTLGGGLNTTNDPDSFSSTISDGDITKTKDEYLQRFNDHFAIDLLTLENLNLRGDPVWLLGPYATADNNILLSMDANDTQTNLREKNILQPHGEKVIFLNIKDVKQYDFMEPERGTRERGKPNIIGGFYGIIGSESTFEDGKFTQTLRGYKMAHLNYAGENMIVENIGKIASKSFAGSPDENITRSEWITQVLDQAQKLPQYSDALSEAKAIKKALSQNDINRFQSIIGSTPGTGQ